MFLSLLSNVFKLLNSEESPLQIGLGFALGAAIALTSAFDFHTVVFLLLICVLNVSFRSAMLSVLALSPLPFILSPLYNQIGRYLLIDSEGLQSLWTQFFNAPYLAFSRLNNTIVMGSLAFSLAAFIPLTLAVALFMKKYHSGLKEKLAATALGRLLSHSNIFAYVKKVWDFMGGKHA